MCNCATLPTAVADLTYWLRNAPSAEVFANYFSPLDCECLVPSLSYTLGDIYQCAFCDQHWYIECAPEETPFPIFAMKLASNVMPSDNEKASHKQFLSILAHKGFSSAPCLSASCSNFALNGRAFCHVHFQFP
jgi:hypothetical protein